MATKIVVGQPVGVTTTPGSSTYRDGVGLSYYISWRVSTFCSHNACFPAFLTWLFTGVMIWAIGAMLSIALWWPAIVTIVLPIVVIFICLVTSYYTMLYRAVYVNPTICRRYDQKMTELHRRAHMDMLLAHTTMLQILSLHERGLFYARLCMASLEVGNGGPWRRMERDCWDMKNWSDFLVALCLRDLVSDNSVRDATRAIC